MEEITQHDIEIALKDLISNGWTDHSAGTTSQDEGYSCIYFTYVFHLSYYSRIIKEIRAFLSTKLDQSCSVFRHIEGSLENHKNAYGEKTGLYQLNFRFVCF